MIYDVDVKRTVSDPLEKTKALLELMSVPFENIDIVDDKAVITTKTQIPEPAVKGLVDNIKKLTKLKSVEFKTEEEVKKELKKEIKEETKQEKKEEKKNN